MPCNIGPTKWLLIFLLVASVKGDPQLGEQGKAILSDSGATIIQGPLSPAPFVTYVVEEMIEALIVEQADPDSYPDPPEDDFDEQREEILLVIER